MLAEQINLSTGSGLIGLLVIILVILLIVYIVRRL
jgi:hypothetical protein